MDPWQSIRVGELALPHRLAMAPMTRDRSTPAGVPTEMNATYYAQRASMGLVITEGTQPSDDGQGYLLTPGIYTPAQVAGWRLVADAVHAAGGKLVIQLMHTGRIGHPDNTPHHRPSVAPSAVGAKGVMVTDKGRVPMPPPRELSSDDIAQTVRDFAHASRCAIEAGADGVEIHGANGYLVHQFLSTNVNRRTDRYGGSRDNRCRFAVEVAAACIDAIGAGRVGIHLSPGSKFNDIVEEDVPELYDTLLGALPPLAYVHYVHQGNDAVHAMFRARWKGVLVVNRPDSDLAARFDDIASGRADLVSIGKLALANPDLVARIRANAPFNTPDPRTFYGGDAKGYIDYPTL